MFSFNQCGAFCIDFLVELFIFYFECAVLFFFFIIETVYLVVKYHDSLKAVSDFCRHVVDISAHLEFELSLVRVFLRLIFTH